jgi:hypothetical protein
MEVFIPPFVFVENSCPYLHGSGNGRFASGLSVNLEAVFLFKIFFIE